MKSLLIALALTSTAALADEASLKKYGCMACHKVDTKVVGPAYKDVAKKYQGKADAVDTLAKKVRTGGKGVWGPVPMPANLSVSEDEAKKLVTYILNLK